MTPEPDVDVDAGSTVWRGVVDRSPAMDSICPPGATVTASDDGGRSMSIASVGPRQLFWLLASPGDDQIQDQGAAPVADFTQRADPDERASVMLTYKPDLSLKAVQAQPTVVERIKKAAPALPANRLPPSCTPLYLSPARTVDTGPATCHVCHG